MKTHFLCEYPELPGQPMEVYNHLGNSMNRRARTDDRRKSQTVLEMTREEFDSTRQDMGTFRFRRPTCPMPVPNVDFEAHDGTLFPTAEACLAYELKARFGVESLDELGVLVRAIKGIPEAMENENELTINPSASLSFTTQDAIRLVSAALKDKGQHPPSIVAATGLPEDVVYNVLTQNPHLFHKGAGGRYYRQDHKEA